MKKLISGVIALSLLLTMMLTVIADAGNRNAAKLNRFNVVFVTDASGSMKATDPDTLRFDAIDLFVSLSARGGNYIGSVMFGDGVVSQRPLAELKSMSEKKAFTDSLREQPFSGWTDIGGGMQAAMDLLAAGGDPGLPSILLLLTDGNTEMATAEQTKQSIAAKETAMETARQKGIKVYTISLNKNQAANSNEMKQIANATGGEFREVSDAADLQSVFDLYYQMIYSTQSIKLVDEKVPADGLISRSFEVADLGVEEVNIVLFGEMTACSVTRPDKTAIPDSELQDMLYTGHSFTLIKIPNPAAGLWNLAVNARPGSTMKIFKIYNSNLKIDAELVNGGESYIKGEPIDFLVHIRENDTRITDTSRYAGYKATLKVLDYAGQEVLNQICDTADADGFRLSFTPDDYGTYYATLSVENAEQRDESEQFTLNVGNTPPKAAKDVIKKHINIWPFLIKTNGTIRLDGAAQDAEDAALQYRIQSSSWLDEDYTLDGSDLTIRNFSVSKGSFTVEAYDSMGAFCTFTVRVTTTNIGVLAAILIFGGALLALVILLLVARFLSQKLFMGTFEVENLAPPHDCTTHQKNRGQLKIRSLQIGPTGLDKDAHFQATGKSYVIFKSKKPVYNDYTGTRSKSFRIESSMDVRISPTEDYAQGIRVRFESMLNNRF